MKSIQRNSVVGFGRLLLLAAVLASLGLTGCGGPGGSRWTPTSSVTGLRVLPQRNQDSADIKPEEMVRVMRRAGFSDQQIVQLGTELHDALLIAGAAKVMNRSKVECHFAVRGDYLFIQTSVRGSFIFDLKRGEFGVVKKPAVN